MRRPRRRLKLRIATIPPNRNSESSRLVGEVLGKAAAGEREDADRKRRQKLIVALERRRLAVTSPTRRKIISVTLCVGQRDATNSAPLDEPPRMRTMAACLARTQSSPSQIAR
jgi:hypothetical protein